MKTLGLKIGWTEIFSGASAVAMTSNSLGFSFYYSVVSQILLIAAALILFTMRKQKAIFKAEHKIMPDAVIGIVDIVASTAICNTVDIVTSFEMKHSFQKTAAKRASENNMMILNDTGDGFLFLANPNAGEAWRGDLARFYEALTEDYKTIMAGVNYNSGNDLESGLRFGVASGAVIVGGIGETGQMTVVGPTVNLAARLCSRAGINQIVFSSQVWERVQTALPNWVSESRVHSDLKGFNKEVSAAHAIGFPKRDVGTQLSVALCFASR
ncbi:MAG: adenylate/guanylate cyclase domain-containing protein [Bdellovibrionales bacterium]